MDITYLYNSLLGIAVLDVHGHLEDCDDGHGEDGSHSDDPANGVCPRRVFVVALRQGFVAEPRVHQDDLEKFRFLFKEEGLEIINNKLLTKMMKGDAVM